MVPGPAGTAIAAATSPWPASELLAQAGQRGAGDERAGHEKPGGERAGVRVDDDLCLVEAEPFLCHREARLVDGLLGAEEQAVPAGGFWLPGGQVRDLSAFGR